MTRWWRTTNGWRRRACACWRLPNDFDSDAWAEFEASEANPVDLVDGLTLVALAGIVDPPRPEARQAIAEAHRAGIAVKMITGDHAATAAAIGHELGLTGEAITGADLDRMDDSELAKRIDDITVFAAWRRSTRCG